MHDREKGRIEVDKQDSLIEVISLKCTSEEKGKLIAVSKQNQISISELVRNIVRKNLYQFAISEQMRKYLQISGEIDMILIEKSVISSRKASNLAKMIEILTDFEIVLKSQSKNFDYDEHKNWKLQIDTVMDLIYSKDSWLYEQLEPLWGRILKMKQYKVLCANL